MSIKIYHGYELKETTVKGIIEWWQKLADKYQPELTKNIAEELGASANLIADTVLASNQKIIPNQASWKGQSPLSIADNELEENIKKRNGDYTLQFTVFSGASKTLGTLHSSNKARDFFIAHSGLEPYQYWNDQECPAELTETEWAQRKNEWDVALLNRTGVPANEGMSLTTDSPLLVRWELLSAYPDGLPCPSTTQRARHIAVDLVTIELMNAKSEQERATPSSWMQAFIEAKTHQRTSELTSVISSILPMRRSWDELKKPIE